MADKSYKGACFCGAVELTVTGEPAAMGYCHCESCRHWSASPVNAFTLWKPDAVMYTKGADFIGSYHKTEKSHRQFCTKCGGHVMTAHPGFDLIDQPGRRLRQHLDVAGVRAHQLRELLPSQCLRRREDAHDTRSRSRNRRFDGGFDRHYRQVVAGAQRIDGNAGCRVAGDDDGLGALRAQELHDGNGTSAHVVFGTVAVRRVAGVGNVNEILGRQFASNLTEHR